MKIALILPTCSQEEIFGGLTGSNPVLPPLDLAYIASYLESRGHAVTIHDCFASGISIEQLKVKLSHLRPQLVGVTVDLPSLSSPLLPRAYEITRICKEIGPDIKTALCGYYPSTFPKEVLKKRISILS
jgi:hypothetical protein